MKKTLLLLATVSLVAACSDPKVAELEREVADMKAKLAAAELKKPVDLSENPFSKESYKEAISNRTQVLFYNSRIKSLNTKIRMTFNIINSADLHAVVRDPVLERQHNQDLEDVHRWGEEANQISRSNFTAAMRFETAASLSHRDFPDLKVLQHSSFAVPAVSTFIASPKPERSTLMSR